MPDQRDILENYIKRLLAIQDQQENGLTEADLKQTALELGLSEEDLERIDREAESHQLRGAGYAEHGQWTDAITEYLQSATLKPLDVSLVFALAEAYKNRWSATGDEADRAEAERCLQQCIAIDPKHSPSYQLLSQIRTSTDEPVSAMTPTKRRAITFGVGVLGLLIVVLMVLSRRLVTDLAPPLPEGPESVVPTPNVSPESADGTRANLPIELPSEWEVPIELMPGKSDGLQLSVQQSLMKNYADSYSHTLRAGLVSVEDEIHRLRLRLDLIEASDEVLKSR